MYSLLSVWTPVAFYFLRASATPSPHVGPLFARQIDRNDKNYYIGYHGDDFETPYAKYFNATQPTLSEEFISGLQESPYPHDLAVDISDGPIALNQPGYLELENGFSRLPDGSLSLTIHTEAPSDLTGEMLDWWFSWHTNDTRKYKLWNPGAHQYAAINPIAKEKSSQKSYSERYWNVTSFVDEYIGTTPYKLSISFFEPSLMGFSKENNESGVLGMVSAFVSLFHYEDQNIAQAKQGLGPLTAVLVHQLRRKPNGRGNEFRSRFWFGNLLVAGMSVAGGSEKLAHDLSVHCFNEMSHLGTFLPGLFEEFKMDVSVGY